MRNNAKNGNLSCFQWIRDFRDKMSRDMAGMTLEERAAYLQARHEKAQTGRPRRSPAEAKRERDKILYPPGPEKMSVSARKPAKSMITA